MDIMGDIDGNINDKSNEREQESSSDERESPTTVIGGKRQDKQHNRTTDIRCHGVKVCLHGAVSESGDDLRQEKRHTLERNTQADLNGQDGIARPVPENFKRLLEVEYLVDDGGRIHLHAVVRKLLLALTEEGCVGCRMGKIPEGERREEDSAAALNDEKLEQLE